MSQAKTRSVRIGMGVKRKPSAEPPIEKPEPNPDLPTPKWGPNPKLRNQILQQGLFRKLPEITAVFDTSKPAQLKKFNELKAKTHPPTAPGVVISHSQTDFYAGVYYVIVTYSPIEYNQTVAP